MKVCSTEFAYHSFLNKQDDPLPLILANGLRPLSDFPDSERWKQIEAHLPGFYENLYNTVAKPILGKPYTNSGVFLSPIDFRLLPDSMLFDTGRIKIPLSRLDPAYSVLTYVWNDQRVSLPLTPATLAETAERWTAEKVVEWFAKDINKLFFYVPQVAVYQPGGISVEAGDVD
ncbi:MAG: hypothetical protein FJZ86_05755 [Chloroflexi bacterium]|nr:hypothetical protein [Chloroflexota bacterium]